MTQPTCIAQVRPWVPSLATEKKGEGRKAGGGARGEGGEGGDRGDGGGNVCSAEAVFLKTEAQGWSAVGRVLTEQQETLNSIADAM